MNHPPTTDADPREIERARDMWHRFTTVTKVSIVAIVIGVILLAWLTL